LLPRIAQTAIDLPDDPGGTFDPFIEIVGQFANFQARQTDSFEGGGKFSPQGIEEFFGTSRRPGQFL
jgi:hypothetical protein